MLADIGFPSLEPRLTCEDFAGRAIPLTLTGCWTEGLETWRDAFWTWTASLVLETVGGIVEQLSDLNNIAGTQVRVQSP